ncbi:MAG: phosphopantetheine-binding protein [Mobilitalea sp.]
MKDKIISIVKQVIYMDSDMDDDLIANADLLVLGMDSLMAIQLIIMLESEFNIEMADEDLMLSTVQSVNNIMSTIEKYKENGSV